MNRHSQLTRLILDFYREDREQLQQIQPLINCKVFRRWGVLHIRCFDRETADAILAVRQLVWEPIAKLRLTKKIKILVDRTPIAVLSASSGKLITEFNQRSRHDAEPGAIL